MEELPVEVIEQHKPLCMRVNICARVRLKKHFPFILIFHPPSVHIAWQVIIIHYYETLPFIGRKLDAFQLLHSTTN